MTRLLMPTIFALLCTTAATAQDFSALVARCKAYGYPEGTTPMADCVRSEAQAEQIKEARQSQIYRCKAAMMGRPTGFGSAGEVLANVNACNADPNAHLADQPGVAVYPFPAPPPQRKQVYCYTSGGNTICREQ